MLVAQPCLTLCDPMDYSRPGSSVHGILQARILERVAIPFSRGCSQSRDWTQVFLTAGRFFTIWAIIHLKYMSLGIRFVYDSLYVLHVNFICTFTSITLLNNDLTLVNYALQNTGFEIVVSLINKYQRYFFLLFVKCKKIQWSNNSTQ